MYIQSLVLTKQFLFFELLACTKDKANVRDYAEKRWLSCALRWAQAIKIVNSNNGVEAQNRLFKYDYLPRSIDKSVF